MSIASAARNAYAVEVAANTPADEEAAAGSDAQSALERVSQWIPSEAVGIYVALLGIFAPKGGGRWILFGVGLALVVLFVGLNVALQNKRGVDQWAKDRKAGDAPTLSRRRLALLLTFAVVAFLTWAWALPASPFLDWTSEATRIGGAVAIVLAPGLPKIAELAGINPPKD